MCVCVCVCVCLYVCVFVCAMFHMPRHIIIHTVSRHHTYYVTPVAMFHMIQETNVCSASKCMYHIKNVYSTSKMYIPHPKYVFRMYILSGECEYANGDILCHIIIHMSHHHTYYQASVSTPTATYYVTSSYICHIIIHTIRRV